MQIRNTKSSRAFRCIVACLAVILFIPQAYAELSFLSESENSGAKGKVNADLQWRIVELYSNERCDLVHALVRPEDYERLRPNILAIVAYCKPDHQESEKLFQLAEREDPAGDLIMAMHAQSVWAVDSEKAKPLWEKVLKFARNPYLQTMAKEYLTDNVAKASNKPLQLSKITIYGRLRAGGSYETNPILRYDSNPGRARPQRVGNLQLLAGAQRWYPFGSISAIYNGAYSRYWMSSDLNTIQNELEIPVNLRMGTHEDLVLRPFGGFDWAGGNPYRSTYGFGVMGIAYRSDYKQYVQGSVYNENLPVARFRAQEGTHFRFDYNWEFYPAAWLFRFQMFMDHVKAANDFNNGTDITYSHTDFGGDLGAQVHLSGITFGLDAKAIFRFDSLPSRYAAPSTGVSAEKTRQDMNWVLTPSFSVPLFSYMQLYAWYEYNKNSSNIGASDYADYNIVNQIFGARLQTQFSNY